MFKKSLVIAFCAMMVMAFSITPIYAVEDQTQVDAFITITDPETGEVWKSELKDAEIQVYPSNVVTRSSSSGMINVETLETAEVTVDVAEYLKAAYPSVYQTLDDQITISTGMSYDPDGLAVSIKTVFGYTENQGDYYATDRIQYWSHPLATPSNGRYEPMSNSWSLVVNTNYAEAFAHLPPQATLDCTVRVYGMGGEKDISVTCQLRYW